MSGCLTPFGDELWLLEGGTVPFVAPPIPARFPYAMRSLVVRLPGGKLFVSSPARLTDERRRAVNALGKVRYLVSPNKLHHLFMGDWAEAYPDARLYASPGLASKRPDLAFARTLGDEAEGAWAGELDQLVFGGSVFMNEVVFFHRKSRTLLLGDLIENHEPALFSPLQRMFARANRMLAPNGQTPLNYRTSFLRRSQARRALARIRAWQPQRIALMHGRCIASDAGGALNRAFGWLG